MWPLVFSRDEPVREAVVDAMYNLYLKDGEGETMYLMNKPPNTSEVMSAEDPYHCRPPASYLQLQTSILRPWP